MEKPGRRMFAKCETALLRLKPLLVGGAAVSMVEKPQTHLTGDKIQWNSERFEALLSRESAENRDAGVSETYQHVHLTEVPLWADASHTMAGLMQTIPLKAGTTVVGEFTARGVGDYTHNVWLAAERGESWARAVFLPWYWHEEYERSWRDDDVPITVEERRYREHLEKVGFEFPLRADGSLIARLAKIRGKRRLLLGDLQSGFRLSDEQLLWRRDRVREFRGDLDLWRREYPGTPAEAFQSSGRRFIAPSVMDRLETRDPVSGGMLVREPLDRGEYEAFRGKRGRMVARFRRREDGRVWRWEKPVADAFYVVDADTASGVGNDFCAAHVLKVSYQMVDVVASFLGKERPHDFAAILARMGRQYRCDMVEDVEKGLSGGTPALMVVEANTHGQNVLYHLDQILKYKRLYRHDDQGVTDNYKRKHKYGFIATKKSKPLATGALLQLVYDDMLRVRCSRSLNELRNLIYLDELGEEKVGAPPGAHDDLAMCLSQGVFVASQRAAFRRVDRGGVSPSHVRMFPVTGR